MKMFQCTALVDSSPHGQCILVEGHQGQHVTPRPAKGGGYSCPACNKVWATMDSFETHVPCAGAQF
jgi:hypothetical protein